MGYTAPTRKTRKRRKQSKLTTLTTTAAKLSRAGMMNPVSEKAGLEFMCNAIINAFQCSVVNGKESKKSYSLLDSESDTETIKNENILDETSYQKISNKAQTAEGRFSNKDDPFYNLDDAPSNRLQAKREKAVKRNAPDLVQFTVDISRLSSDPGSSGLSSDPGSSGYSG
jgi:hypothetical protein